MTQPLPAIPTLLWETIRAPRDAAQRILALDLPRQTLWEALALGVVLTVVVIVSMVLAAPIDPTDPTEAALQEMYAQPIPVVIGQMISAVTMVYAIALVGRWFGGAGTFDGALALVAWHQIFLLCMALGGILVGMVFPPILSLMLFAMIGLYFYVLTQFVCALHGFGNALVVFLMILVSFFAILIAVSIVTGILVTLFFGAPANV